MRKLIPVILGCSLIAVSFTTAFAQNTLETQKEKVSYSIGLNIGMNLKVLDNDVDLEKVIMGLKDGQSGATPKLSEEEIKTVMTAFQAKMQAKQKAQAVLVATLNAEEGASFLAKNKDEDGVTTLDSGLQYKVITKGTGDSPKASDTVSVHYRGTLLNGTEFDSSYKRGEPAVFPVGGVIKGWVEALQLMKVGSKWELYVPSELAYGDRGAGQSIGPNSLLIFEVELLEIKKSE